MRCGGRQQPASGAANGGNHGQQINGRQFNDNYHNHDQEVITANIDPDSPSATEMMEEEGVNQR